MPRPKRCRKVCSLPLHTTFVPMGRDFTAKDAVVMTVDEYETIRLIDYQNCTQEECGEYMKIARTTVQQIYMNARKKVSISLVDSRPLCIEGGDYQLCDGKELHCDCGGCPRHRCLQTAQDTEQA
ncbi:MAG: DUF134 domain-containing protein [Christensenellaceae bacterium]